MKIVADLLGDVPQQGGFFNIELRTLYVHSSHSIPICWLVIVVQHPGCEAVFQFPQAPAVPAGRQLDQARGDVKF